MKCDVGRGSKREIFHDKACYLLFFEACECIISSPAKVTINNILFHNIFNNSDARALLLAELNSLASKPWNLLLKQGP